MIVRGTKRLCAVDITEEYPGFATDLQAQYMATMTERRRHLPSSPRRFFENRFMHAQELARMGSNIRIEGQPGHCGGRCRTADCRAGDCLLTCAPALPWCLRQWWRREKP